jgi:hypothetical protein
VLALTTAPPCSKNATRVCAFSSYQFDFVTEAEQKKQFWAICCCLWRRIFVSIEADFSSLQIRVSFSLQD